MSKSDYGLANSLVYLSPIPSFKNKFVAIRNRLCIGILSSAVNWFSSQYRSRVAENSWRQVRKFTVFPDNIYVKKQSN